MMKNGITIIPRAHDNAATPNLNQNYLYLFRKNIKEYLFWHQKKCELRNDFYSNGKIELNAAKKLIIRQYRNLSKMTGFNLTTYLESTNLSPTEQSHIQSVITNANKCLIDLTAGCTVS